MYNLHFLVAACKFNFFFSREKTRLLGVIGPSHVGACVSRKKLFSLFYCSVYFCYYSWAPLHFLVLFMGPTLLFQLTFTFIYSTFSKKCSVMQNKRTQADPKTSYITKSKKKIELFFLIIIASFTNCMRHSIDYSLYAFRTF